MRERDWDERARGREWDESWRSEERGRSEPGWGERWRSEPGRPGQAGYGGYHGGYGTYGTYGEQRHGERPWVGQTERPGWAGTYGGYGAYGTGDYGQGYAEHGRFDEERMRRGRFAGVGPRNWQRSDERIRDDIAERLTDHPDIDASDIEVQVANGVVTLTGTVDDRRMKRLAEDVAESVSGVRDVRNELQVKQREGLMERIGDTLSGRP
ncbi:MAG TPA: BON domain-containing protein [Candidatus Limnocylindrales bacterium]|nr:BON domain-containing protein [Candidatus Limnocylindrales bacterium]